MKKETKKQRRARIIKAKMVKMMDLYNDYNWQSASKTRQELFEIMANTKKWGTFSKYAKKTLEKMVNTTLNDKRFSIQTWSVAKCLLDMTKNHVN